MKRSDSDQTEVRHAQRVQLAARKLAIQRQQNKLFMAQEIKRQLEEAEVELCDVEQQGVEIEKQLKENTESKQTVETLNFDLSLPVYRIFNLCLHIITIHAILFIYQEEAGAS